MLMYVARMANGEWRIRQLTSDEGSKENNLCTAKLAGTA